MRKTLRRIAALLLCVSALFSLFLLSACRNDEEKNKPDESSALSEAQRANILAISEAFIESGKIYSSEYALSIKEIEEFVYYLYNDELTPDVEGYASIPGSEAAERLKMYFGISSILHTQRNSTDQNFYYHNEKYFVKTNPSVVKSCEIVSAEQNESGNYLVKVHAIGENDARVELDFVFKLDGDNTLVLSCSRYDEK
ncbi:MAG: hypothetical protein IKZ82_04975 [Clostridia bacterium]|nr:hypothetical protein [Clostridia bacterium]